jgi:hypothetical protein
MIGRSQVRQGAAINTGNASSDARAMAARSSVGTATASPSSTAAKPSPSPVNKATGSKKPGSIVSSFDLFDVIKGHLLDEGYADTEESALAIMANMSEEWRQSIVEDADKARFQAQYNALGGDAGARRSGVIDKGGKHIDPVKARHTSQYNALGGDAGARRNGVIR